MRTDALLSILQTMAETTAILRAQYRWSKAYRDQEGVLQAVDMSLALEDDLYSLLLEAPYEYESLTGIKIPKGTPEEIIEAMRMTANIESGRISNLMRTIPGDIPELEERRKAAADKRILALGTFFRKMRQILKENWPGYWGPEYDKEFKKYLKMKLSKKRRK